MGDFFIGALSPLLLRVVAALGSPRVRIESELENKTKIKNLDTNLVGAPKKCPSRTLAGARRHMVRVEENVHRRRRPSAGCLRVPRAIRSRRTRTQRTTSVRRRRFSQLINTVLTTVLRFPAEKRNRKKKNPTVINHQKHIVINPRNDPMLKTHTITPSSIIIIIIQVYASEYVR